MSAQAPTTDDIRTSPTTNGTSGGAPRVESEPDADELVEEARTALHGYIESTDGATQNSTARAIGRGASTISQFLRDKYSGDDSSIARDVLDFLRRERERQERPSEAAPVETSSFQRIRSITSLCHAEKEVGVIVGEAGLGKTLSLTAYAEAHEASTLRIEVGPEYTAKGLCQALHTHTGGDGTGTIYTLMQDVFRVLEGTDRLVIVDQAEILPTRGLELCRRVHDVCGVGLVLAGMPRLLAHLQGSRGELKQLYSRVGFKAKLSPCTDDDVEKLVVALVPGAVGGVAEKVASISRTPRIIGKLLKRARHIAQMNDRQVDAAVVEKATQMLVIPDPDGR